MSRTALFIDDQPHTIVDFKIALEAAGWLCRVVTDADKALDEIDGLDSRVHLVVLDILIPAATTRPPARIALAGASLSHEETMAGLDVFKRIAEINALQLLGRQTRHLIPVAVLSHIARERFETFLVAYSKLCPAGAYSIWEKTKAAPVFAREIEAWLKEVQKAEAESVIQRFRGLERSVLHLIKARLDKRLDELK